MSLSKRNKSDLVGLILIYVVLPIVLVGCCCGVLAVAG